MTSLNGGSKRSSRENASEERREPILRSAGRQDRTFASIVGQDKALTLLRRAVAGQRLAHAYLFLGPDGVGKTTTALALARLLLCTAADGRPCGLCPGCIRTASANHPDLVRIRPEGTAVKIDQVRAMRQKLNYPPFEAGLRVVLLEDVHTMRREAGNSLLKILEEPPPDNLLILIGNDSDNILGTIASRCQLIPFIALPEESAAQIIRQNRPDLEQEEALTLAALTEGCPGQALTLEAGAMLDMFRQMIKQLLQPGEFLPQRIEHALFAAAGMASLKDGLEALLALLRIFLKNLMVDRAGGLSSSLFAADLPRARELWNLERLSAMMQAVDAAELALAGNCNRALVCEVLMLDLFGCTPSNTV